ncbi:hypothetical protein [Pseudonocardia sp. Ae263_Ps1]|uniref:hypothetical protein n=1 Tax=Pseudonocardia sp. Ae263_Ps1 TaxID=1885030 RepID=UPI000B06479F|nr:hypothetical protein [Pseudonocardia sp. Ae263_Ps1]
MKAYLKDNSASQDPATPPGEASRDVCGCVVRAGLDVGLWALNPLDPGELAAVAAVTGAAGWSGAGVLSLSGPPAPRMCTHCVRRSGRARGTVLDSVVCDRCWAAITGDADPGAGDAEAAGVLPRTARDWREAIEASTWYQQARRDVRRRLDPLLNELALRADWADHYTWPTWARLQEVSGWARSSVASWLAKLREAGWLLLVESGSTPQYRGPLQTAIHGRCGNRAAVYQLRLPDHAVTASNTAAAPDDARHAPLTEIGDIPSDIPSESFSAGPSEAPPGSLRGESWTPTRFTLTEGKSSVHTRAKTIIHTPARARAGARPAARPWLQARPVRPVRPEPACHARRYGDWFDDRVPLTGGEMLAAARQLHDDPHLARLSPRAIRARIKPFWRAGWTNNDLRHALAHQPSTDGPARRVERCPASQVRWPTAWLRHRLAPWTSPSGPLTAPHVDATHRAGLAARHGHAAAQRLPYGHTQLTVAALHADDQQRTQARALLVRNQTRDRHALLTGLVPDHDVISVGARETAYAQITALLADRRSRRLSSTGASCSPPTPAPGRALPRRTNGAAAPLPVLAR